MGNHLPLITVQKQILAPAGEEMIFCIPQQHRYPVTEQTGSIDDISCLYLVTGRRNKRPDPVCKISRYDLKAGIQPDTIVHRIARRCNRQLIGTDNAAAGRDQRRGHIPGDIRLQLPRPVP